MTQTAKLTAIDGAENDQFGNSVAISGDTIVGGAPGATIGTEDLHGAAYVFQAPTLWVPAMNRWGLMICGMLIAVGALCLMRRRQIIS